MSVKRMKIIFQMIEINEKDEAERTVTSDTDFDDGATHPQITEKYNDFLRGCGYVWGVNDKITFCRYNNDTGTWEPEFYDE